MKKHFFFLGASIIVSTIVLLDSCKKDETVQSQIASPQIEKDALKFIEENLTNQYTLLTSTGDKVENTKKAITLNYQSLDTYVNAVQQISKRKEKLEKDDFKYVDFKLSLNPDETALKFEKNKIVAKVALNYSMTTNSIDSETGERIVTEGTEYYNYEIIKTDNNWKIIREEKCSDFPTNDLTSDQKSTSLNEEEPAGSRSVLYTYSAQNAVTYATLYYNNPNPSYANYSSIGGDCTNFVSQCVKAGGWAMNNYWKYYGANIPNRTPSWTGAYQFYQYLTYSGSSRVVYVFQDVPLYSWYSWPSTVQAFKDATSVVNKGDILQLSNTTVKTSVHHSTIVTSKDAIAKKVFVTYRNATAYPVAKNRYIGDFSGGYVQGFKVKLSGN